MIIITLFAAGGLRRATSFVEECGWPVVYLVVQVQLLLRRKKPRKWRAQQRVLGLELLPFVFFEQVLLAKKLGILALSLT